MHSVNTYSITGMISWWVLVGRTVLIVVMETVAMTAVGLSCTCSYNIAHEYT